MSHFNRTIPPFANPHDASSSATQMSMMTELANRWASYRAQPPVEFTAHVSSVPAGSVRDSRVENLPVNLPVNYSQADPVLGSFADGGVPTMPAGHSAPVAWPDTSMHGSMNPARFGPDTYSASQATMFSSPGITAYTGAVNGVGLSTSIHTDMSLPIMYPGFDATLSDASIGHNGIHEQSTSAEVYAAPRSTVRSEPHSTSYAGVAHNAMSISTETYDVSQSPTSAAGTPVLTYTRSQPVTNSYSALPTPSYAGVEGVYELDTRISAYINVHSAPQPFAGPAGSHTDSRANAHSAPMSTFAETYVVLSPPPTCAEPRTTMYGGVSESGGSVPHSTLSAGQYSVFQPGAYPERHPDIFDDGSRAMMPTHVTHVNVDGVSEPVAYSMPPTTLSAGPAGSDGQHGVSQPGMPTHSNEHGAPQPVTYPTHRTLPPAGVSGAHTSPRANTHSPPRQLRTKRMELSCPPALEIALTARKLVPTAVPGPPVVSLLRTQHKVSDATSGLTISRRSTRTSCINVVDAKRR
ncbi:hypothetical protein A0H81_07062 [Grifola frondosa]|uniref:Uncharacterized protein n=1 Tax=Grifola frondosa TaxID=5627 RepID=A0A1C7M7P1_GRIFR|nr:hypothetical protein A0H81_07062 [Grifola frondosa]